jgi:four helix bundle protein
MLYYLHIAKRKVENTMFYKELTVWQKSMELVKETYLLVKKLPKEETYALSDQMRRAAISIPSNIAEGNGRKSLTDYARFLDIARGSEYELETQFEICIMLGYLTETDCKKVFELINEIGRMLHTLITKLKTQSKTSN